jgi:formate hydrogenlyase subunit 6/NADH:ubiquinone oxidoreductase subunit I
VEVCPEDAIKHGAGYEFAGFKREDAVMTLDKLVKNEPNESDPEKMGTVASARFIRDKDGIRIEADGKKRYRWW